MLGGWAWLVAVLVYLTAGNASAADDSPPRYEIATFTIDVTIPLGHRCMGTLPTKSQRVLDPLYAHGAVILGTELPLVLVAIDWCEIRNASYDQWRRALAAAANTSPQRILVAALHQHDAPVIDHGAARLLAEEGLPGELFDEVFHDDVVERATEALRDSLATKQPVTHLGIGQAQVNRIASNRRVVLEDGRVTFWRGSRSGADPLYRDAPEGLIDPYLRTLSFWNEGQPVVAIHSYATHPMSSYGRGEVSADFVGLARHRRQRDDASVKQIYVSGCSGDITAGKYNDGSPEDRDQLIDNLYDAMVRAWADTELHPIEQIVFRNTSIRLDFSTEPHLSQESLEELLRDEEQTVEKRIWAAMGLSSRERTAAGQPIDMPCIDLGPAKLVLFPGESFVGFQLLAQQFCPDAVLFPIGYGECWTGYVPTAAAFADGFADSWLWVAPGAEAQITAALQKLLP